MRVVLRFRYIVWAVVSALLLLVPIPSVAQMYEPEHLIVEMAPGYTIDEVNSSFGTSVAQYLNRLNIYLLNAGPDRNLEALADSIQAMTAVNICHPNFLVSPLQSVQGSIPISDLNERIDYESQAAVSRLDLAVVHSTVTGTGVRVAVIDGGVNYLHPILSGAVQSGYDYVDDDADAFDEPGGVNSGHGTFVAGLIHLIAPNAQIVAYRVTDTAGESHGYLVAESILRAIDDGCRVINLSMVMTSTHYAIQRAISLARSYGVVVVVAAGNGQDDPERYPAVDSRALAVAAVDSTDILADFSCFGSHISVCAPGVNVCSPYLDTIYARWSGTSFAAPFVSAQAALILSNRPELSSSQIESAITATGEDIDDINPDFEGNLGSGLLDLSASLVFDPVVCGDIDCDGSFSMGEITDVVNYVNMLNLPPPDYPMDVADVDSREGIDAGDIMYMVNYIFNNGSAPCEGGIPGDPISGGHILLDHIEGLVNDTTIAVSTPATFYLRVINNTPTSVMAVSAGFEVTSDAAAAPDNVSISVVGGDNAPLTSMEKVIAGPMTADNLGVFCFAVFGTYGLPVGDSTGYIAVTVGPFGPEYAGKTITLDSAFFSRGGTWCWYGADRNRYVADWDGPYTLTVSDVMYKAGDVDGSGEVNVSDLTFLVKYLFALGFAPDNLLAGDVDGSCGPPDVSDLTYLVDYLFRNGERPVDACSAYSQ